jgi:hypothetical protein
MTMQLNHSPIAHIRFEGQSLDLPFVELNLGLAASNDDIKQTAATHLRVNPARLREYVVDRHESGNVTVRPQAVFG